MAKELPYFRFTVQEWQNGDISLESYELKGLFIDVCGFYWVKDCDISLSVLKKKFRDFKEGIDDLISLEIIKVDKNENISINFLDNQLTELDSVRKKRSISGAKGGKKASRWGDVERKKGSQLYVILMHNSNEIFIKIGVTDISISSRYSVPTDYNITTLYQHFCTNPTELEIEINSKLKEFAYSPTKKFGGYTECLSIESLRDLSLIMRELGCLEIANYKQTMIELQANYKQTSSYKDKDNDKEKDKENDNSVSEFSESKAIDAIPPDDGKPKPLKLPKTESIQIPDQTEQDLEVKKLTYSIAEFFNISEQLNANSYFEISRFVQHFNNLEKIDLPKSQFKSYRELKILDGCKHSWKNFIGDPKEKYQNGAWCEKTWSKELIEYKGKQSKFNNNGPIETPIVLSKARHNNPV